MAKKITELPDLATPDAADIIPLVDTSGSITKRTTVAGVASQIPAGTVTNAMFSTTSGQPGGAWASWTPSFANFTVGGGTVVGKYSRVGNMVFYSLSIILSGSTMGTAPTFTLPVTSVTYSTSMPIGQGIFLDSGTATYEAQVRWATTTTALMAHYTTGGVGAGTAVSTPFTWANGDQIQINGFYEAAA